MYILYNSIKSSKTWKLIYCDRADRLFTGGGMGGQGGVGGRKYKKRKHEQTFGGNGDVHDSDGSSSFTGVCMCHN